MMELARQSVSMDVQELNELSVFKDMAWEWNQLAEGSGREVFHRHEFIRMWIESFQPRARFRLLAGTDGRGKLTAALPLIEEHARWYGVPIRQLSSASNAHSCRFDLLALEPQVAGEAIFERLARDPRWDVLRILDVPESGNAWRLYEAAQARGFPTGTWESLRSPFVPLPKTYDELAATLQTKFKANLRRRRRKLEERGKLTFERVSGGSEADLDGWLAQGFALEESGWKGQRGTAIAQDAATRGFYVELARQMASANKLSLYFLKLNGAPIAFQYGLTEGDRYFLLKPGYDERHADCSPGQLLVDEVMRDCIGRGLREFDFLGPDMTWKRDWTDQVRVHTWLYVFRDSRFGRALHAAKFRWIPSARKALARWKQ